MVVGAGFRWMNGLHGERGVGSILLLVCLLSLVVLGGAVRAHAISLGLSFFFFFHRVGELVGSRKGCAPRKTSGLVAKYDTRERGEFTKHLAEKGILAYPSRPFRFAKPLFWDTGLVQCYCTGSIILSHLLVGSALYHGTICKENFTKPVRPGFSQISH